MDPLSATVGLALVIGGPLAALLAARRWAHPDAVARRRARRVARVATDRLADGVVARVRGRARDTGEMAAAPVSGRDCLAWTLELRSRSAAEADVVRLASPDWDLIARVQGGVTFLIDDATGVVRVDPSEATLTLGAPVRFARGLGARVPPPVRSALEARVAEPLPRSFRVVERVLGVDDAVEAVGLPRREPGEPSDGGYRGADDRWGMSTPDGGSIIIVAG